MRTPDAETLAAAKAVLGRTPDQTGFVVPDVEVAARHCLDTWGIGPWSGFTYSADVFAWRRYLGGEGAFETKSVVWGGGRWSFIQPVSGESTYAQQLRDLGPGLHHAGYFTTDIAVEKHLMMDAGGEEVMAMGGHGLDGDGELAFWTLPGTTAVVELIQPPARRREPQFTIG